MTRSEGRHADRRRRELEVLHRIAVTLSRSLSVNEVLDALARELMFAVDRASECALSLWDIEGDQLVDIAAAAEAGPVSWPRGEMYAPLDLYPATRTMLARGRGYLEYRITDPGLRQADREVLDYWGWRSAVEMPLVVEGRSLGLIEVADHRSARTWSKHDVEFCQTIASQAALAVRNAQLFEDLQQQIDRDPLTGLLNHRAFYERLSGEMARARRAGQELAVLVLDLDNFKTLNDSRGHLAGDDALRALADLLMSSCRSGDVAGRLGGDEFALILPGPAVDPLAAARRLIGEAQGQADLSLSIGCATLAANDRSAVRLVARADRALLAAKAEGKRTFRAAA